MRACVFDNYEHRADNRARRPRLEQQPSEGHFYVSQLQQQQQLGVGRESVQSSCVGVDDAHDDNNRRRRRCIKCAEDASPTNDDDRDHEPVMLATVV